MHALLDAAHAYHPRKAATLLTLALATCLVLQARPTASARTTLPADTTNIKEVLLFPAMKPEESEKKKADHP